MSTTANGAGNMTHEWHTVTDITGAVFNVSNGTDVAGNRYPSTLYGASNGNYSKRVKYMTFCTYLATCRSQSAGILMLVEHV